MQENYTFAKCIENLRFSNFPLYPEAEPSGNSLIKVARSTDITGPYLDKSGEKLDHDGGRFIAKQDEDWATVGHQAAYTFSSTDYLILHDYDKSNEGKTKLIIRKIQWEEDWSDFFIISETFPPE